MTLLMIPEVPESALPFKTNAGGQAPVKLTHRLLNTSFKTLLNVNFMGCAAKEKRAMKPV